VKGLSFEKVLTASAYGYQIVRHPFRRSTVSKRFAVVERLLQRDALCVYTPSGFRLSALKGMCFSAWQQRKSAESQEQLCFALAKAKEVCCWAGCW